jgi:type VI secretion system protein ImpH
MAASRRRETACLKDILLANPERFEFFQAVRLLTRHDPGHAPVGTQDDPNREGLRLSADSSMVFPTSDIVTIEKPDAQGPTCVTVAFFGIATPASFGSLPIPYVEHVLSLREKKNMELYDFLNLLNHRFLSLFYRAQQKYRVAMLYECETPGAVSPFERIVLAVSGVDAAAKATTLPFDHRLLLRHASSMRRGTLPALALEELLAAHFGVLVGIVQFVPRWYEMDPADRSCLGTAASHLGADIVLGGRVEDAQGGFRIRVGPLTWNQFQTFLPVGDAHAELSDIVRQSIGPELGFDLELVLDDRDSPQMCLGAPEAGGQPLLGWSSWLCSSTGVQHGRSVIVGST